MLPAAGGTVTTRASGRRGAILIAALCLLVLMAVLASHQFYMMMLEQRNSNLRLREVQAFEAAQAGLDDARVKMSKSFTWMSMSANQKVFVYTAMLNASVPTSSFRITIEPLDVGLRVTSRGFVGPPQAPLAQRQLTALFNTSNGHYTQFIDWGSL